MPSLGSPKRARAGSIARRTANGSGPRGPKRFPWPRVAQQHCRHRRGEGLLARQRLAQGFFNNCVTGGKLTREGTVFVQRSRVEVWRAAAPHDEQVGGKRFQRALIRVESPVRPAGFLLSLAGVRLAGWDYENAPVSRHPDVLADAVPLRASGECRDDHFVVEMGPVAVLEAAAGKQLDASIAQGGVSP